MAPIQRPSSPSRLNQGTGSTIPAAQSSAQGSGTTTTALLGSQSQNTSAIRDTLRAAPSNPGSVNMSPPRRPTEQTLPFRSGGSAGAPGFETTQNLASGSHLSAALTPLLIPHLNESALEAWVTDTGLDATAEDDDGLRTPTGRPPEIQAQLDDAATLPNGAAIYSFLEEERHARHDPALCADFLIAMLGSPGAKQESGFLYLLEEIRKIKSAPTEAARALSAAAQSPVDTIIRSDALRNRFLTRAFHFSAELAFELDFERRPRTVNDPVFTVVSRLPSIDRRSMDNFIELADGRAASMNHKPIEKAKMLTAFSAGLGVLTQRLTDPSQLSILVQAIEKMHVKIDAELKEIKRGFRERRTRLGALEPTDAAEKKGLDEDKKRFKAIVADQQFASRCAIRSFHHDMMDSENTDLIEARFFDAVDRIKRGVGGVASDAGGQLADLFVQCARLRRNTDGSIDRVRATLLNKVADALLDEVEELSPEQLAAALVGTYSFEQNQDDELNFKSFIEWRDEFLTVRAGMMEDMSDDDKSRLELRTTKMLQRAALSGDLPFEEEHLRLPILDREKSPEPPRILAQGANTASTQ